MASQSGKGMVLTDTIVMKNLTLLVLMLFTPLALSGCGEEKVTLNLIQRDATGQCWSEWYTVPISYANTTDRARQYIADEKIKPFDLTVVSC